MAEIEHNETAKSEAAYPIYDLQEALRVADAVRQLGGGNSPVSKSLLAKHLKYAESGPSFFQRIAAARSFAVIDGRGAYSLTGWGKQYFFPTTENGKEIASVKMLSFPKAFSILIQKFDGDKLPNLDVIGNIIHAEANIPVSKKNILAGCFLRSAKFIGVIDAGGFLRCKALVSAGKRVLDGIDNGQIPKHFTVDESAPESLQADHQTKDSDQHTIYLSGDKKRMVKLVAPLTISNAEFQRICNWIKVALIVEDEKPQ